ncbi:hypothetical protein SK128_027202 [Halocaridina rubra]|uniref:Uncharacterized protein n=1 Tax=Halocaridina rubra TaxID=373956 RepID=A0AAN8X1C1_HALRR
MILKKRRSMKAASACENNVGLAEHTTNAALEADITPDNSSFVISIEEEYTAYRKMLYLGVAFAANIGGTGSPLGCGPNFVIFGILQSTFAESTGLNFATWMLLNVPGMILCLSLGWCWLMLHFKQYRSCKKRGSDNMGDEEQEESIRDFLLDHYKALGPLSQHEIRVGVSFSILVLLWIFRSPGFITGWAFYISSSFEDNLLIRDATPVIFMVFLLFIIPAGSSTANNNQYNPGLNREECKRRENAFEACLTWEVVQARVPWGVVLLLGGGLALAEGSKVSGLSSWLGHQLTKVAIMPKEAIVFTITILSAMVTEVASNTATASVILPVILDLALAIQVNPLYLMLPATVCCAYAFMLPVATPGNAIILTASGLSTYEMVKAGFMMNILCVLVINFTINTLGNAIFDLHTMPTWAINATVTGNGT